MPCDSTITGTSITNVLLLKGALEDLGYDVTRADDKLVEATKDGSEISFRRYSTEQGFQTDSRDIDVIDAVQRKHSENAIRGWAGRNGYTIDMDDENQGTLINRRGK